MDLIRAWIADLVTAGYPFPAVQRHSGNAMDTQEALALPPTPAMWHRYDNIVLVIMFNNPPPSFLSELETFRTAYTPVFRTIIYTGFDRPAEVPAHYKWVDCDGHIGRYQQMCFANVIQVCHCPHRQGLCI